MIFVQHTSPKTVWYSDEEEWKHFGNQSLMATHIRFPFSVGKGLLNVMVHGAHHANPGTPSYYHIERQNQLEELYKDRISVEQFSISWLMELFRKCRLYDYKKHQWLDFDGRPTTVAVDLGAGADVRGDRAA